MKPSEIESLTKAIAAVIAKFVEEKIKPLQKRIDELASRPNFQYRGAHKEGNEYSRGEFVTDHGSLWVCKCSTNVRPGLSPEHWTLAVKSGKG